MTDIFAANEILGEIYSTGLVVLPSGEARPAAQNGMPQAEARHLCELVRRERPVASLEVGMAFGLSTLAICQALRDAGVGHHIVVDPNQTRDYGAAGLYHLERAGLRNLVDFYEESSHRVLPRLEASGTCLDFAFVDGVHLFDFTLLEFFYIDRMLRVGGLIVFDDLQLPAIRQVVRYAVTNRGYVDESSAPDTGLVRYLGRRAKRLLRGLTALPIALRYAAADERRELLAFEVGWPRRNGLAVLRKVQNDDRHWMFHVPF